MLPGQLTIIVGATLAPAQSMMKMEQPSEVPCIGSASSTLTQTRSAFVLLDD